MKIAIPFLRIWAFLPGNASSAVLFCVGVIATLAGQWIYNELRSTVVYPVAPYIIDSGPYYPGDSVSLTLSVIRYVACAKGLGLFRIYHATPERELIIIDSERWSELGEQDFGYTRPLLQVPATAGPTPATLSIHLPTTMPPGRYIIWLGTTCEAPTDATDAQPIIVEVDERPTAH